MKGQKPNSGTISFASKKIDTATLYISDYIVDYKNKEYIIRKSDNSSNSSKNYKEGDVIYFNVDEGGKCDNYTEAQSAVGVKSGCMKFYVLNVYEDSLDLILDHNVVDNSQWEIKSENNNSSTFTLYGSTYKWKGVIPPENYTATSYNGETYTIDYSKYSDALTEPFKARLPQMEEIISKQKWYQKLNDSDKNNWMTLYNTAFENYQNNLLFDAMEALGLTEEEAEANQEAIMAKAVELWKTGDFSIPKWLISNLEPQNAYWTATMDNSNTSSEYIWLVGHLMEDIGALSTQSKNSADYGVRPVIRVLKSTVENEGISSEQGNSKQEPLEKVYFDVTNGAICNSEDANGISSGCMKFYVLNKTSERVTLILDHDIADNVYWCDRCYDYNPSTLLNAIQIKTSSWNGVLPLKNYTASNGVVIDYTNYKARIPTFEELIIHTQWYKRLEDITSINAKYETRYTEFSQELLFEYYLNNYTEEQLLEYIKKTDIALPQELQSNEAYWLATPYTLSDSTNIVYLVSASTITNKVVSAYDGINFRPVIEISADLVD